MLISVNQFRRWLRESAKALRAGGAEASADIYEEIEARLDVEADDIRDECERQVREARGQVPDDVQAMLEARGLMVVPAEWSKVE